MGRVGTNLKRVSTKRRRSCKKPGCETGSYRISRHHMAHEFMFVSAFVRTRFRETRYKEFVSRYYEFRKEDTVDVCDLHHNEVHILYDKLIKADLAKRGKKLNQYSWREAWSLMKQLEAACRQWLTVKTPGSKRRRGTRAGYQSAVRDLKQRWGL